VLPCIISFLLKVFITTVTLSVKRLLIFLSVGTLLGITKYTITPPANTIHSILHNVQPPLKILKIEKVALSGDEGKFTGDEEPIGDEPVVAYGLYERLLIILNTIIKDYILII
jgi:hypothetical protein